jgi:hypothetical protein
MCRLFLQMSQWKIFWHKFSILADVNGFICRQGVGGAQDLRKTKKLPQKASDGKRSYKCLCIVVYVYDQLMIHTISLFLCVQNYSCTEAVIHKQIYIVSPYISTFPLINSIIYAQYHERNIEQSLIS